jgi:alkylation response protein AidB-like acyl-CoA dehydrogenase
VTGALDTAQRIANELLFEAAIDTDRSKRVPVKHLDALAAAGLYAIAGPREAGGLDASLKEQASISEALASGCLATTFVWLQHHGSVRALARTDNQSLREQWLEPLCAGRRRGGLVLGGVRPSPRQLRARAVPGGWLLTGDVAWVTGWDRVDVLYTLALSRPSGSAAPDVPDDLVSMLVDAVPSDTLRSAPRRLVAADASGTVQLAFADHFVSTSRVLSIAPYTPPPAYDGGGRLNGSLALGVVRRCCMLLGPSGFDARLEEQRGLLDAASDESMAEARAGAAELALRASAALITALGSPSITLEHHAQRLAREALFLLTFGTRPAIRAALSARLCAGR